MSQTESEKTSLDQVLRWIDNLSPEELSELERKLNEKFWSLRIQRLAAIPSQTSAALQQFIERVESGDIDVDIREASDRAWQFVLERMLTFSESSQSAAQHSATSSCEEQGDHGSTISDDSVAHLEQMYAELYSNLIGVRQAVALALASEQQLERQLQQNHKQAATWQERANIAKGQQNTDLEHQALERGQQYVEAASALQEQLKIQKDEAATLGQRLHKLEEQVQKVYTKKQLLIARDKAARATYRANEIMSRFSDRDIQSLMAQIENDVTEREKKAAAFAADSIDLSSLDSDQILFRVVTALERATAVIEKMEERLAKHE